VRAFKGVGGEPIFFDRGEGSRLVDVSGKSYIDYVLSWGPLIHGHAHPKVVAGLEATLKKGTSFGAPHPLEVELVTRINRLVPSMEKIRLVSSGTEATMSAIRLARAFTRRDKLIKFDGGYHGHADFLLVKAGSGVATLGLPDSPGVTRGNASDTLVANYNDLDSVKAHFEAFPGEVACLIVEPVAGNMGVVLPDDHFLKGLRDLCSENGALLIFDEVMTGFRVHIGGAQALYNVTPDLTCLGKVIGGGMPAAAYGGKKEIMNLIAPLGPVYQAGTLSGNPLAMRAGIETLDLLTTPGVFERIESQTHKLIQGVRRLSKAKNLTIQNVGTMFTIFFCEGCVRNLNDAKRSDSKRYASFFHNLLREGIYFPPSALEAGFLSSVHTDADIDNTIIAIEKSL
jgi:glutamate-1-semialdehyde 2,1-aminomutase